MQIFWNKTFFAKNAAGDRQMHNLHEMLWAGDRPITKLAGNRRMQPVTGELTWFGFLATHIGEKNGRFNNFLKVVEWSKVGSHIRQKNVVKLFSTMGFIFDHLFRAHHLFAISTTSAIFRDTNTLTKT